MVQKSTERVKHAGLNLTSTQVLIKGSLVQFILLPWKRTESKEHIYIAQDKTLG